MAEVIDASVAIKWFVDEKDRDPALGVLERVLSAPRTFCVPELFFFELAHVFNRLIPDPSADQIELLDIVINLGVHRFAMTPEVAAGVRRFQALGLSGYDSAYVALAEITKGVWLTYDKKAAKLVPDKKLTRVLGA
jgi:predicted nucleic acid-binding protein